MQDHSTDPTPEEIKAALAKGGVTEPQQEEAKPDGYYLTCSPEELKAELRRRKISFKGHGLPRN